MPTNAPPDAGPSGITLSVDVPVDAGVQWSNARLDGALIAVDLSLGAELTDVYGVALRGQLGQTSFVRAQPAADWPIARIESTATGLVAVLSESGPSPGRSLKPGLLMTLWLQPADGATTGALAIDPGHSGVVVSNGTRLTVDWGAARWSLQ
jgi:hypothetical protein